MRLLQRITTLSGDMCLDERYLRELFLLKRMLRRCGPYPSVHGPTNLASKRGGSVKLEDHV